MSLVVAAVIVWGTWGLLRESLQLSLDAVPPDIEPSEVRGLSRAMRRRRQHPRSAHLGDEHHGECPHGRIW